MKKTFKTSPDEILEGPILKTLIRLAVPTIIAFIFHTGFNFIDRFFVSRLGEIQFGAVGMAFTVQMTMIAVGGGLGIGVSSLIARLIGAREFEQANKAADQTLFLIIVCSLIATIGGLLIIKPLFLLLGASDLMRPYIFGYIRIILYGSLFQFFAMLGSGIAAAALTIAGQNYGAKKLERIRSLNIRAVVFSMSLLTTVMLLFISFSASLVRVFSKSPDVVSIGKVLLIIGSIGFPAIGSRLVHASIFQGLGMGVKALILNMSQMVFFSLPLAWFMSHWIGLNGIWWGMTTGMYLAAIMGFLWIGVTLRHLKVCDQYPVISN